MIHKIQRIFGVGGLSESGKSSAGRYLDSRGIRRLKFVVFFRQIMQRVDPEANFDEWQKKAIDNRPEWLWEEFLKVLVQRLEEERISCAALESLYRPSLALAMRRTLGAKFVVVYIDIPEEIRLERQVIRQNLSSLEEAKRLLLPRDAEKLTWGALQIRDMADEVIDNSGSINKFHQKLDEAISKYCPPRQ